MSSHAPALAKAPVPVEPGRLSAGHDRGQGAGAANVTTASLMGLGSWGQRVAPSGAPPSPGASSAPPSVLNVLHRPGQPLEGATRAIMEARFCHDFSRVRVHADHEAAASARAMNAHAYTVGQHVVFSPGRYRPWTQGGQRLLAHELAHVVQQAGVRRRASGPLTVGRLDDPQEWEAEQVAASVTAGRRLRAPLTPSPLVLRRAPAGPGAVASECIGLGGQDVFDLSASSETLYLFDVGTDNLRPDDQRILEEFAASLGSDTIIEIHGFASEEGPPELNEQLACARAVKVRSILLSKGVGSNQIRALFEHGATPGPRPERRSAVITIVGTEPAPTDTPKSVEPPPPPPEPKQRKRRRKEKKKRKKPREITDPGWDLIKDPPPRCSICGPLQDLLEREKKLRKRIRDVLPFDLLFDVDAGKLLMVIGGGLIVGALLYLVTPFLLAKLGLILQAARLALLLDEIKEYEQVLKDLVELTEQFEGSPEAGEEGRLPHPDVDSEGPRTNEVGCQIEPIAMKFGRYPCHARFAAHVSGVGREVRVITPEGDSVDFDGIDWGQTLYEVKTGYRWLLSTHPAMQARIREVTNRFIDQSDEQYYVADRCGLGLRWVFNEKGVADYFTNTVPIQPPVDYEAFDCKVDSDD